MAKNYFKSYIWLLETLQSKGPLTLTEIKQLWLHSSINDEGKELATRTFANHIISIADIFGIDIVCDRRNNKYHIENSDALNGQGVRTWLLDALSLNSLLNESASLKDRIIFENVPSSHQFLPTIIQAIRDNKTILVHYQSYTMENERTFEIEPYFIREFKRRWYLYGHKEYDNDVQPHMYALDRMKNVEIQEKSFQMPEDINASDWFQFIYGIRRYDDMRSEKIILKVYGKQVLFFRSLPLHISQEEIETKQDYSLFSYYLTPDYDFKQDILSFGDSIEVIEPLSLRAVIASTIESMKNYYKSNL